MKLTLALFISGFAFFSNAQQMESPKLVVGIVVDQMCYEYLYRYYDKFCDGGLRLLMNEGTNCRNTNFNYIPTFTGPGHASIYTGTTPNNHGIVANDWFDRSTGKSINCVEDTSVKTVGTNSSYGFYSPVNLKANTITDQLKLTYPKAKVISMSIKNRGAILPGGHLSDGSYWYDYTTGTFITSTFFADALPTWVSKFNGEKRVEKYLEKEWNTIMDISAYSESGPDNSVYEHLLPGKSTPTFPYNLKEMTQGVPDYNLFTYTPFANTYLTDFALASIDSEGLGKDDQTDMLCISYSTPDIMGHAFGTYSVEIEDMYIRFDLDIKKLIEQLEAKVGKGEFTLFLTADHAAVPVPQYLIDNGLPGGYFFLDKNMAALRSSVTEKFGADFILAEDNLNVYLDYAKITASKNKKEEVARFVADEIQQWEGVKRVFTGEQLYNKSSDHEWMDMIRKGYHHAESGDVMFILEPGYLPKLVDSESARKGTSHGSAFSYDTHVPLLWYGKNIPAKEIHRLITIPDITATLAQMLFVQNPNALTGLPIVELLDK